LFDGVKTNFFISVFVAGLLICSIPAVKGGEGFVASVAQEATTVTILDVAGATGTVGAAFAIGEDPASTVPVAAIIPIDPNMPGNGYSNNGYNRYNDNDYYTNDGSRYCANTNSLYWTGNPPSGKPVSGCTNTSIYPRR
jgi:hypothetical protein